MKNLPVIVSFPPGAGGRFLQAAINHIITGWPVPVIDTIGSSHSPDECAQKIGEFILLWNDDFSKQYVSMFEQSLGETMQKINMPHWNVSPDKYKYYITEDINRADYSIAKSKIISEHLNKGMCAPVVRTHITHMPTLRDVTKLVNNPITLATISVDTSTDTAICKVLDLLKNYPSQYPNANCPEIVDAFTFHKKKSVTEETGITKKNNEFRLPFKHIWTKDVDSVLAYVEQIAQYCGVPTVGRTSEVTRFIIEYFSKQPDLSHLLTQGEQIGSI